MSRVWPKPSFMLRAFFYIFCWSCVSCFARSFSSVHFFSTKLTNSLNPIRTPRCYQPPFCGGCTNQFQISWLFPITSLLSSGKVIFHFFVISTKKSPSNFFFHPKKRKIFWRKWSKTFFSQKYCHFLFQLCDQYALRFFLRCITCL